MKYIENCHTQCEALKYKDLKPEDVFYYRDTATKPAIRMVVKEMDQHGNYRNVALTDGGGRTKTASLDGGTYYRDWRVELLPDAIVCGNKK